MGGRAARTPGKRSAWLFGVSEDEGGRDESDGCFERPQEVFGSKLWRRREHPSKR